MTNDSKERQPQASTVGTIVLIGGNEDKLGSRMILHAVAARAGSGKLVVATLASEEPERQWQRYEGIFRELGLSQVQHLALESREQAMDPASAAVLDGASAIFFTGGDQVKITTKLGGTSLYRRIRSLYEDERGLIAGTSAGAAAMGETMLASHGTESSHRVEGAFFMTRGLGLVRDMVIDQHFAQRARIERLVGAVAENPGVLGIGIDEDTAVILPGHNEFQVIGSGAVYVVDGHEVTYTNVSEQAFQRTLCLFDMRFHVLSHNTAFNLGTRRPHTLAGKDAGLE